MVQITPQPGYEFLSTKTYTHSLGLSACFRQHQAQSHCRFLHGYALQVKLTFGTQKLDAHNWVVDFGSMKSLKAALENEFDHKCLVASDDPYLGLFMEMGYRGLIDIVVCDAVSCEAFSYFIYGMTEEWLIDNEYSDVSLISVEVSEHQGNSAIYRKISRGD